MLRRILMFVLLFWAPMTAKHHRVEIARTLLELPSLRPQISENYLLGIGGIYQDSDSADQPGADVICFGLGSKARGPEFQGELKEAKILMREGQKQLYTSWMLS